MRRFAKQQPQPQPQPQHKNHKMIKEKIKKIYANGIKIHMPFFITDDILLCSFGFDNLKIENNHYWKIGYIDKFSLEDYSLINTGMIDESVNCCPYGFILNNKVNISFVANSIYPQDFNYKLYSMSGYELNNLENLNIVEETNCGILTEKDMFYIKAESMTSYLLYKNHKIIMKFKNMSVLRVNSSYHGLTLTIDHHQHGLFEVLITRDGLKSIKLKDKDFSPYKCHLYKNLLAYTIKGEHFEDRILDITEDYYFVDLPENIKGDIEIVNNWNANL